MNGNSPIKLLRECSHKEILLTRYIVRDAISGLEFAFCPRCWMKYQRLKGFELVEYSQRPLVTKSLQIKLDKEVPF